MAKAQFGTDDAIETEDTPDEVVAEVPASSKPTSQPRTYPRNRKPAPAKAVSARRLTAKTKYQTVQNIVKDEKAVTETSTVAELLGILKERVFEEAVG